VDGADGDVAKLAEVAERDLAERVDFVVADAVVDRRWLVEGLGLDECIERAIGVCRLRARCGLMLL
jgi:hypothetical protein